MARNCTMWWIISFTVASLFTYCNGSVLEVSDEPRTFLHAYHTCKQQKKHLVSAESYDQSSILADLTLQSNKSVWLLGTGRSTDWLWTYDKTPLSNNSCSNSQTFDHDASEPYEASFVLSNCSKKCKQMKRHYFVLDIQELQCSCSHGSLNKEATPEFLCDDKCTIQTSSSSQPTCSESTHLKVYFIGDETAEWTPLELNADGNCAVIWKILFNEITKIIMRKTNCHGHYQSICAGQVGNLPSYKVLPNQTTWDVSHGDCLHEEDELLKVDASIIRKVINDSNIKLYTPYWIGLTSSSWNWHQTADYEAFTATQWDDMEPKPLDGISCLVMGPNGKWSSVSCCEEKNYYICEEDKENETTPSVQMLDEDLLHLCKDDLSFLDPTTTAVPTTGSLNNQVSGFVNESSGGLDILPIVVGVVVGGGCFLLILILACVYIKKRKRVPQEKSESAQNQGYDKDPSDGECEQPNAEFSKPKAAPMGQSNRESGVPIVDNDLYNTNQAQVQNDSNDVYAEVNKPKKPNLPHPQIHPKPKAQTTREPGSETYELAGPGFDHNAGRRNGPSTGVVRPPNPRAYEVVPGFKDI